MDQCESSDCARYINDLTSVNQLNFSQVSTPILSFNRGYNYFNSSSLGNLNLKKNQIPILYTASNLSPPTILIDYSHGSEYSDYTFLYQKTPFDNIFFYKTSNDANLRYYWYVNVQEIRRFDYIPINLQTTGIYNILVSLSSYSLTNLTSNNYKVNVSLYNNISTITSTSHNQNSFLTNSTTLLDQYTSSLSTNNETFLVTESSNQNILNTNKMITIDIFTTNNTTDKESNTITEIDIQRLSYSNNTAYIYPISYTDLTYYGSLTRTQSNTENSLYTNYFTTLLSSNGLPNNESSLITSNNLPNDESSIMTESNNQNSLFISTEFTIDSTTHESNNNESLMTSYNAMQDLFHKNTTDNMYFLTSDKKLFNTWPVKNFITNQSFTYSYIDILSNLLIDNSDSHNISFKIGNIPITALNKILQFENIDLNNCMINCSNNGLCIKSKSKFICKCSQGFYGSSCQFKDDPCSTVRCLNKGNCLHKIIEKNKAIVYCNCTYSFYGNSCQERINICENTTCSGKGVCNVIKNLPVCNCFSQFSGRDCEFESNEIKLTKKIILSTVAIAICTICLFYALFILTDIFDLFMRKSYESI